MNPEWVLKARENATRGIPPQDASGPDALEMEISAFSREVFSQEGNPITKDAESVAELLNKERSTVAEVRQNISRRAPVEQLEELLKADLEAARPENVKVLKSKKRAGIHLSIFKADNELTRHADKQRTFPDIAAKLSISLAIETAANAYFYSTGIGYLAGAGIAFFFSFIIAMLGFAGGFFARFRNSRHLSEQLWGWVAVVLSVLIAVYVSSVTATFRALMEIAKLQKDAQTDLSAQSPVLFERAIIEGRQIFLFHVPFHELNATLLFALAIIAFVYAAYVGYTSSDVVPGYSKVSEDFERHEAVADAAESKVRADLNRLANGMKTDRSRLISAISEAWNVQRDLGIKSDSCAKRLAQLAERTNNEHFHAVNSCRVENANHRATQPPAYFAEPVARLDFDTDPLVLKNLRADLDLLKTEIAELEPFAEPMNAEIIELEQLRATLAETITQNVKAWDVQAEKELDDEAKYVGARVTAAADQP
jgi:hypothetical protein